MAQIDTLCAISPVDGRYRSKTKELDSLMSEFGLIQHRLTAMVQHLVCLSETDGVPMRMISSAEKNFLLELPANLTADQADVIKQIEMAGYDEIKATNHDVKACELYLKLRMRGNSLADLVEMVHFGCTSEDVNNIAYSLMLGSAFSKHIYSLLCRIEEALSELANKHADLPMLARTHGQPATPTTFGKEFNNYRARVKVQFVKLVHHCFLVKLNGASGNYNALVAALPDVDWVSYSADYVSRLAHRFSVRLKMNPLTTQIEPHDSWVEFFNTLALLNTILIGFCQDIWRYVSDDWLVQKPVEGEVGSSTMPHKVNPIDFENAEGNLGMANSMFIFFAAKLPISRLQRDLSDSTVERNFGAALADCVIAYQSILKGLGKISVNETKVRASLDEHPEVITEAYQTILRLAGYPDPYGVMKDVARGKKPTLRDLHRVVDGLDVGDDVKERLRAITPANYVGLAPELALRR